jgi:hypothetical protein
MNPAAARERKRPACRPFGVIGIFVVARWNKCKANNSCANYSPSYPDFEMFKLTLQSLYRKIGGTLQPRGAFRRGFKRMAATKAQFGGFSGCE